MLRRMSGTLLRAIASPKFAGLPEYGATLPGAYLLRRALYMPWELEDYFDPTELSQGWEELGLLRRMATSIDGIANARQAGAALEMRWDMKNQLCRGSDW